MAGYLYIMATKRYGTIYTGVTSNLARRIWEHKNDVLPGLDPALSGARPRVLRALRPHRSRHPAEHNIKHWKRAWKTALVDGMNPEWNDLHSTLI